MLLFALLLGLALHFISDDKRCKAGIQFASSNRLRVVVRSHCFDESLSLIACFHYSELSVVYQDTISEPQAPFLNRLE